MYVHSMPLAMLSKSIVSEVTKGMYVDVIIKARIETPMRRLNS